MFFINRSYLFFIISISIFFTSMNAYSQDIFSTPDKCAQKYIKLVKEGKWDEVAKIMHPEALNDFKNIFAQVAEIDNDGSILRSIINTKDKTEFMSLSPDILFSRFMIAFSKYSPDLLSTLSGAKIDIIGYFIEEKSKIAYLVYQMNLSANGTTIQRLSVLPLKMYNRSWMVLLTGDIKNIAALLKQ